MHGIKMSQDAINAIIRNMYNENKILNYGQC